MKGKKRIGIAITFDENYQNKSNIESEIKPAKKERIERSERSHIKVMHWKSNTMKKNVEKNHKNYHSFLSLAIRNRLFFYFVSYKIKIK